MQVQAGTAQTLPAQSTVLEQRFNDTSRSKSAIQCDQSLIISVLQMLPNIQFIHFVLIEALDYQIWKAANMQVQKAKTYSVPYLPWLCKFNFIMFW